MRWAWQLLIACSHRSYSAFTLATLEPSQTSLILFSKFNTNRVASTWEVPVVVLLSTFKNKTRPVWPSSEVASVNALLETNVPGIGNYSRDPIATRTKCFADDGCAGKGLQLSPVANAKATEEQ